MEESDLLEIKKNKLIIDYWKSKCCEMVTLCEKLFYEVDNIIDEFNKYILNKKDDFEGNSSVLVENRLKGILMITKMNKNALDNGLRRIKQCQDESEEKIIIKCYFSNIETYLLPIVDGIERGINYINIIEDEHVKNEIMPIYKKLSEIYDDFFKKININKINIYTKEKLDLKKMDIIDVEFVNNKELDELVESVIRSCYEYPEDIYNQGHYYVVRKAQVIAYKYREKEVDEYEL